MFPPNLSTLSIAVEVFQLVHLVPTAYAATPLKFTLEWEFKNLTADELHSRFKTGGTEYRTRDGVLLSLGTPRQDVYLKPTLLEDETYVLDVSHCADWAVCEDISGGLFAANESSTWKVTRPPDATTTDEISQELWNATKENFSLGIDVGEFPGASVNLTLDGLEFGLVTGDSQFSPRQLEFSNTLGLGPRSHFLINLVQKYIIPGAAFGYYNGTLDIGGIDENRISGKRVSSPIVADAWGGLRVTVTNVEVNNQSIMGDQKPFAAGIPFGWQHSFFPPSIYERFFNVTGGHDPMNDTNFDGENGMVFPGWNDTVVPYTGFNLTVTLSNGYKLITPERAVRTPLVRSGTNGGMEQLEPTGYSYSIIQSLSDIISSKNLPDDPLAHGVEGFLSLAFLNHTYLYVDHERKVFELVDAKRSGNSTSGGSGGDGDDKGAASVLKGNFYAWGLALLFSTIMVFT